MNPWLVACLDVSLLLALAFDPRAHLLRPRVLVLGAVQVVLGLCLGAVGIVALVGVLRIVTDEMPVAVLNPNEWLGQPLVFEDEASERDPFNSGTWIVVIHQPGCTACAGLLSRLRGFNARQENPGQVVRVGVIALPGEGEAEPGLGEEPRWKILRLSESKRWVVEGPKVLFLEDGIVTRTGDSLSAALGESDAR